MVAAVGGAIAGGVAAAALAENEREAAEIGLMAGAAVGLVVGLAAPFLPALFGLAPLAPKAGEELSRPRAVGPLQRAAEFFTRPFTPRICEQAQESAGGAASRLTEINRRLRELKQILEDRPHMNWNTWRQINDEIRALEDEALNLFPPKEQRKNNLVNNLSDEV